MDWFVRAQAEWSNEEGEEKGGEEGNTGRDNWNWVPLMGLYGNLTQ